MEKTWDKVHQPCPLCDSSDAVGINEDGSAKCFSCGEFMPDYNKACELCLTEKSLNLLLLSME